MSMRPEEIIRTAVFTFGPEKQTPDAALVKFRISKVSRIPGNNK